MKNKHPNPSPPGKMSCTMWSLIVGFYPDNDLKRDTAGVRTAIDGCSLHLPARETRLPGCFNTRTSWRWFKRCALKFYLALHLLLSKNLYKRNFPSLVLITPLGLLRAHVCCHPGIRTWLLLWWSCRRSSREKMILRRRLWRDNFLSQVVYLRLHTFSKLLRCEWPSRFKINLNLAVLRIIDRTRTPWRPALLLSEYLTLVKPIVSSPSCMSLLQFATVQLFESVECYNHPNQNKLVHALTNCR